MSLVKKRISICNFICVALLLAMVCVQLFAPFYTFVVKEESVEVSLGKYIWFPNESNNKKLTSHFTHKDVFGAEEVIEQFGEKFKIDEIAFPHLYMLILAGFGLVFCLLKNRSAVPSLFGLAAGVIAIVNFTSNRALLIANQYQDRVTANQTICTVCVALGALLIVNSLISVFGGLIAKLLTKKPAKA